MQVGNEEQQRMLLPISERGRQEIGRDRQEIGPEIPTA
jgi:hypothetical protein